MSVIEETSTLIAHRIGKWAHVSAHCANDEALVDHLRSQLQDKCHTAAADNGYRLDPAHPFEFKLSNQSAQSFIENRWIAFGELGVLLTRRQMIEIRLAESYERIQSLRNELATLDAQGESHEWIWDAQLVEVRQETVKEAVARLTDALYDERQYRKSLDAMLEELD